MGLGCPRTAPFGRIGSERRDAGDGGAPPGMTSREQRRPVTRRCALRCRGPERMRRRTRRILFLGPAALLGGLALLNASWLAPPATAPPKLLAHRGLGQTFDLEGVDGDTCTAERIHAPEHPYLENTIDGIAAAFAAGAEIVEIDLHRTADDRLVVFHDAQLDCRTDGTGRPEDHTLDALKQLDVGYGYTADGGQTFPFRGKGRGAMPSLDDVLHAFPGKRLLFDLKASDRELGRRLGEQLASLSAEQRRQMWAYGAEDAVGALEEVVPEIRSFGRSGVKACMKEYLMVGWTSWVPEACRGTVMLVPMNVAPWLWGWPRRLQARLQAVDTELVVIGPWHGEAHTRGVDTVEELRGVSREFDGWVWTNRVDRLAASVAQE
jgi:glycerophosphoryl diester phosphodiesterase